MNTVLTPRLLFRWRFLSLSQYRYRTLKFASATLLYSTRNRAPSGSFGRTLSFICACDTPRLLIDSLYAGGLQSRPRILCTTPNLVSRSTAAHISRARTRLALRGRRRSVVGGGQARCIRLYRRRPVSPLVDGRCYLVLIRCALYTEGMPHSWNTVPGTKTYRQLHIVDVHTHAPSIRSGEVTSNR